MDFSWLRQSFEGAVDKFVETLAGGSTKNLQRTKLSNFHRRKTSKLFFERFQNSLTVVYRLIMRCEPVHDLGLIGLGDVLYSAFWRYL